VGYRLVWLVFSCVVACFYGGCLVLGSGRETPVFVATVLSIVLTGNCCGGVWVWDKPSAY
jgi:hypothetical protein